MSADNRHSVERTWELEVMNKWEGPNHSKRIMFEPMGDPLEVSPWWYRKHLDGSPLDLTVTDREFALVEVGHIVLMRLTIDMDQEG